MIIARTVSRWRIRGHSFHGVRQRRGCASECGGGSRSRVRSVAGDARGCEFPKPPQWQHPREFCGPSTTCLGATHHLWREMHFAPTKRLTLVEIRPGSTMQSAKQSTTCGAERASEFEDEGSNASGEEDVEVPIVEEVPPVRPSVRVDRVGLNSWTSGVCQSCFRTGPL